MRHKKWNTERKGDKAEGTNISKAVQSQFLLYSWINLKYSFALLFFLLNLLFSWAWKHILISLILKQKKGEEKSSFEHILPPGISSVISKLQVTITTSCPPNLQKTSHQVRFFYHFAENFFLKLSVISMLLNPLVKFNFIISSIRRKWSFNSFLIIPSLVFWDIIFFWFFSYLGQWDYFLSFLCFFLTLLPTQICLTCHLSFLLSFSIYI